MGNTKAKGYILGAVAAATYGMNPLFALPLYKDMDPSSVLFFRYLIALPILAAMLRFRGRSLKIQKKEILPLAIMGLLMAVSSITLFSSYTYMEAGIASTILFVYPIMVAVIMAVFFKEKLTIKTGICILLALAGIALLYRGGDGSTLDLRGTMLVLISALSYSIYIVGVNLSALKEVPTLKVTFYVLLFGLSLFIVKLNFGSDITLPGKWYMWGNLLALAVFPTVISFVCTTSAIHCIGSTPTARLGALEPLTAVFFGITVFGESVTPRIVTGICLIIAAVTLIVAQGDITGYMVRFRKMFPKLPKVGRRARQSQRPSGTDAISRKK